MAIIFLSFVVVTGMGGQVSLDAGELRDRGRLRRRAGRSPTTSASNIPGFVAHGQINFFWAVVDRGARRPPRSARCSRWPLTRLGRRELRARHVGVGVLPRARAVRRSTPSATARAVGRSAHPTLDVPGLNWLNDFLVHKLEWTGDVAHLPKMDFTPAAGADPAVPRRVRPAHAGRSTRLMRSASGRAALAVRSSEVAAEASGIKVNRSKILMFALVGRDRRHRWRAARHVLVRSSPTPPRPCSPGLIWLALAVTFGIRRPGGALLAGFAFAGGTAVFHWISSWSFLSGGDVQALITSIYFVPILSGLGAIQLAQEPDGILSLAGQQKLRKKREKARLARIAEAEAAAHGGVVPEHERQHAHGRVGERRARRDARAALSDADVTEATFAMRGVVAGYGDAEVLHGVDLRVDARQGHRAARRQRCRQVDAVRGRGRHGRRLARRGVPRGRGDHRRRVVPAGPRRASCSCPRHAASSPA